MAFNIGYISVPRLFPIKFQSTIYAIVNFSAHIVACLAPLLAEIPSPIPFVGFLAAIGVSALFLKTLTELEQQKEVWVQEKDLEQNYHEVQENSGISIKDELHR